MLGLGAFVGLILAALVIGPLNASVPAWLYQCAWLFGAFAVLLRRVPRRCCCRKPGASAKRSAGVVAELLLDLPVAERPPPFKRLEHTFSSFGLARAWLGNPEIEEAPPERR